MKMEPGGACPARVTDQVGHTRWPLCNRATRLLLGLFDDLVESTLLAGGKSKKKMDI
jgi:hypothetical protein